MFQHTAARRRLPTGSWAAGRPQKFQHTAARRRLHPVMRRVIQPRTVSTHSRPKAAAGACPPARCPAPCFNTQPPEGGCQPLGVCASARRHGFNTPPPEGGCAPVLAPLL